MEEKLNIIDDNIINYLFDSNGKIKDNLPDKRGTIRKILLFIITGKSNYDKYDYRDRDILNLINNLIENENSITLRNIEVYITFLNEKNDNISSIFNYLNFPMYKKILNEVINKVNNILKDNNFDEKDLTTDELLISNEKFEKYLSDCNSIFINEFYDEVKREGETLMMKINLIILKMKLNKKRKI